jgi:hypothetical protein
MLMKFLATQERMDLGKVTFWLCTTNITSSEVVRPYNKQEGKQKANVSIKKFGDLSFYFLNHIFWDIPAISFCHYRL